MRYLFVKPSDPVLTKIAIPITPNQINSKETLKIIQTMLKVAYGNQKDSQRPIMVGLAAPQIGVLKRIILVDTAADGISKVGNLKIYINPQVIWRSKMEKEWYEGCYSTGKVCGIVSRPISVKIQGFYLTPSLNWLIESDSTPGRCKTKDKTSFPLPMWERSLEKFSGYTARIFQHEIDHLDGKVFVDLVKDPQKLHWVNKKEFTLYRNKEAWRNWPGKCTFFKWEKIKKGL